MSQCLQQILLVQLSKKLLLNATGPPQGHQQYENSRSFMTNNTDTNHNTNPNLNANYKSNNVKKNKNNCQHRKFGTQAQHLMASYAGSQ